MALVLGLFLVLGFSTTTSQRSLLERGKEVAVFGGEHLGGSDGSDGRGPERVSLKM